jgi:hypothetical protein
MTAKALENSLTKEVQSAPTSHAEGTGLRCGICGATASRRRGVKFRSEADLARHMTIAHPGQAAASDGSAAECDGGNKGNRSAVKNRQRATRASISPMASHVKFCPQCGCNLEIVNAAISIVHGH